MNYILALLILAAYAWFNSRKAKLGFLEWIKANPMTMVAATVVMVGVVLLPKVATGTAMIVWGLPVLSSWGLISIISNVFTAVGAWVSKITDGL